MQDPDIILRGDRRFGRRPKKTPKDAVKAELSGGQQFKMELHYCRR